MADADEFQRVARDYLETYHRLNPVEASWLGIHSYDDRLGDFSAHGFAERLGVVQEFAARLASLRADGLERHDRTDYAWLVSELENNRWWLEKVAHWRRDPDLYAEAPLMGLLIFSSREYAPLDARMECAIGRLREVRGVLEAGRANVVDPPRIFTEMAIHTCTGGLEFLTQAFPSLAEQVPIHRDQLCAAARDAADAYRSYVQYLREDLLSRSNGSFVIGRELYEERLQRWHMLDLSADELSALGRRLFDDTRLEVERLAAEIDPRRSWAELVAEAKRDHPSASELLDAYRRELDSLKAFIQARDLVTIPANEELVVVETPVFLRAVTPYAAYMPPGAFESRQLGQFWVTPVDPARSADEQEAQLQEHCSHSFPITALHEAYPGHHVQLVRANNTGSFVRKHAGSDLLAEGWAFYCEHLFAEQGYYRDKRLHLFQLKDQLWRAARIIIDVGLQTGTMDVDEAVRLLVEGVHLSEQGARAEVRRYTKSPTQPITYAMGKHEILRLRNEFPGVPLREFHDALLATGTLPLKLVREELLERWR
ncbi:MAG: DUF885 domain-containing protein [Chloroflexi bacterium]|nr:DUF885 domain-containing protein [Chloroflexota bacterium]